MPHLSDGELHAYLDGALDLLDGGHRRAVRGGRGGRAEEVREHLRSCEACRSRLEEERRLLERSSAILEAGGPGEVDAPPLEELRERARARAGVAEGGDGRWRRMPRTQALAWAATVVLALGIGWMTRDVVEGPTAVSRPAAESSPPAPASGTRDLEDAVPAPERATEGRPSSGTASAPPEEPDAVAAEEAETEPVRRPPAEAAAPAREPSAEPRTEPAREAPAEPDPTPEALPGKIQLEAIVVEGAADAGAGAEAGAARVRGATPESATAVAADRTAQAREPGAPRTLDEGLDEGRVGLDAMTVVPETSVHVPGLRVLLVEPVSDPAGLLVLQELASGDTLRLRWISGDVVERAAGLEATPLREPLPAGWSQVVLPRGTGWLVIRAPLPEEELRALVSGR